MLKKKALVLRKKGRYQICVFENMITVVFQNVFYSMTHKNNNFLFFKNYF